MEDKIGAISSNNKSGRTEKSNTDYNTPKSYNQDEWLNNQWKKGYTVWTISAGAAYNS